MEQMKCRICENIKDNAIIVAKERMFGTKEEFEYFECHECGCIQIKEIPSDVKKYYPDHYYSYGSTEFITHGKGMETIKNYLKMIFIRLRLQNRCFLREMGSPYKGFPWLIYGMANFSSAVLDVGCGNGDLLLRLHKCGFKNLAGIDPFIESDIEYPFGVSIRKKSFLEENKCYDLIMFHHSLEHMENPVSIFMQIYKLLNRNGYALVRVPVSQSYAWRKYKTDWVQFDAPRHFFLHSTKSIVLLAEKAGLKLSRIRYDSNKFQFAGSEKYLRNIPFQAADSNIFEAKEIKGFEKAAKTLNLMNDGDSACFYLYKD